MKCSVNGCHAEVVVPHYVELLGGEIDLCKPHIMRMKKKESFAMHRDEATNRRIDMLLNFIKLNKSLSDK
jgi:hypothetical protein